MTLIALILSILLGTISLAIGYSQAGAFTYSLWFLLLAALWSSIRDVRGEATR